MHLSDFHYLRSRACVAAAVEQHEQGAEGLACILVQLSVKEGRCSRIHARFEHSLKNHKEGVKP